MAERKAWLEPLRNSDPVLRSDALLKGKPLEAAPSRREREIAERFQRAENGGLPFTIMRAGAPLSVICRISGDSATCYPSHAADPKVRAELEQKILSAGGSSSTATRLGQAFSGKTGNSIAPQDQPQFQKPFFLSADEARHARYESVAKAWDAAHTPAEQQAAANDITPVISPVLLNRADFINKGETPIPIADEREIGIAHLLGKAETQNSPVTWEDENGKEYQTTCSPAGRGKYSCVNEGFEPFTVSALELRRARYANAENAWDAAHTR
ncbi:MAG: hypothetical protein PW734_03455 [Verrucomicrobium sp.]|nr:hypothetical protein [Verrucomicrobium sp.]